MAPELGLPKKKSSDRIVLLGVLSLVVIVGVSLTYIIQAIWPKSEKNYPSTLLFETQSDDFDWCGENCIVFSSQFGISRVQVEITKSGKTLLATADNPSLVVSSKQTLQDISSNQSGNIIAYTDGSYNASKVKFIDGSGRIREVGNGHWPTVTEEGQILYLRDVFRNGQIVRIHTLYDPTTNHNLYIFGEEMHSPLQVYPLKDGAYNIVTQDIEEEDHAAKLFQVDKLTADHTPREINIGGEDSLFFTRCFYPDIKIGGNPICKQDQKPAKAIPNCLDPDIGPNSQIVCYKSGNSFKDSGIAINGKIIKYGYYTVTRYSPDGKWIAYFYPGDLDCYRENMIEKGCQPAGIYIIEAP